MPTQTGSIDFTSTGGFKSYATNKYATQSTVSQMQTDISQNATDIALRATKTEVQQVRPAYASSSTAAGTAAKVATIDPAVTGYALYKGASVAVTFSTANTAATPTLNLNSTGAKQIRSYTGATLSEAEYKWAAGATIDLVYDGTYWRMQDGGAVKRVTAAEASISVNAENIESKVSKDGVISSINQSAETVKIQASKVEIDGTAVFSAISSDVDDAITSKGYQTSSQVNSAITSKGYATTTQAQSYATTAKSEAISAANTATDQKLTSYSTTQQMNEAIQGATGPLFYGRANSTGYIHLGHVPYAVRSASNYSHLHLTGRIGGWLSTTSGSVDVTFKSRTDNALYNTVDRRDETIDTSFVDVLVYTGTDGFTHYWLKVNSYWYAQLYAEFEQFVKDDHTLTTTEPDGTCVWRLSEHTAVAATKSNAVKRTQRIWYRKSTSGAPATPGTASSNWVTKDDDGNDAWTKMHIAISSTHKYIYTCEQYEMANGTVGYTSVLLDNTITVIDGGNIITGTVTANKLNAANINASKSLTVGAMTDAAASTILNSNVQIGGRNLLGNTENRSGSAIVSNSASTSTFGSIGNYNDSVSLYSLVNYDGYSNAVSCATSTSTGNRGAGWYTKAGEIRAGETYTFSCRVKCSIATNVHTHMAWRNGSATAGYTGWTAGGTKAISANTWTDYSYTFVPNSIAQLNWEFFVAMCITGSSSGATYQIAHAKLEKGNKAADWTPAPEDITAEKYITSIDDNGIRVHAKSNTTTNYAAIDADGMDVVKGGVSVAQFGKDNGNGPSARIGKEASTHVTISASETSGTGYTEDTSELGLYEATGTSPDLRLYNTTRTYDTSAGQMHGTEVGIELGQEGALSDGATIRSDIQPLGTTVLMTVGSSTGTRDSDANVTSVNGKGTAQLTTHVDGWSDSGATATLGASATDGGSASVEVHADAETTSVEVVGESISVWDGDSTHSMVGAFPTHGVVNGNQSTGTPANGYKDFTVSFGHTYRAAPHVVVGFYSTSTASALGGLSCAVNSITYTGCTIRVFNNTSSQRSPAVEWIAIG